MSNGLSLSDTEALEVRTCSIKKRSSNFMIGTQTNIVEKLGSDLGEMGGGV